MDLNTFFEKVRLQSSPNLGDLVYQYIKEEIIELRMAPGEKISLATLSKTLNTSRTPVRTALTRLIEDGMVEDSDEFGFRVKPILLHDYMALCDMRRIIEGNAAYMATTLATDEDMGRLKALIEHGRSCKQSEDSNGFANADAQFHVAIVRMTRNNYMLSSYQSLEADIRRYRFACARYRGKCYVEDTKHALGAHIAIYRAMKNKFASVAKEVMVSHIDHTAQTVIDLSWDLR